MVNLVNYDDFAYKINLFGSNNSVSFSDIFVWMDATRDKFELDVDYGLDFDYTDEIWQLTAYFNDIELAVEFAIKFG